VTCGNQGSLRKPRHSFPRTGERRRETRTLPSFSQRYCLSDRRTERRSFPRAISVRLDCLRPSRDRNRERDRLPLPSREHFHCVEVIANPRPLLVRRMRPSVYPISTAFRRLTASRERGALRS